MKILPELRVPTGHGNEFLFFRDGFIREKETASQKANTEKTIYETALEKNATR